MTERELQTAVIDQARLFGWRIAHFQTARTMRDGAAYMTPQIGHRGFPDLVLLRPPRLIFAELKSKGRNPDFDQATWLNAIDACPGVEQYCWRPADWELGAIDEVLR